MERNSEFDDINDKLEMIRRRGIDSINIDLMYAIPGEKLATLKKDLAKFVKLKPTHISTYSLIIEDHTKIKNQNVYFYEILFGKKNHSKFKKCLFLWTT